MQIHMHMKQSPFHHRQPQSTDMMAHLLEVEDRMMNTLHKVQQKGSPDHYKNELKTCTGDSSIKFNS